MRGFHHVTVTIKLFSLYTGVTRHTASKYYKTYLSALGKKPWMKLTIQEIALLDDVKQDFVAKKMGIIDINNGQNGQNGQNG